MPSTSCGEWKGVTRKGRQQLRENSGALGRCKPARAGRRAGCPAGQAFQAAENHPAGWEGKASALGGVEALGPAPGCQHSWLVSGGAAAGPGAVGRGSYCWWRQGGLPASWGEEPGLLPRQVEDPQPSRLPQPKYLTLVVARSREHFNKTVLLEENRKLTSPCV